jgi:gluconate kinase
VIQERDILRSENGNVTFQYRDAKTDKMARRTLPGADFLRHVLHHVECDHPIRWTPDRV